MKTEEYAKSIKRKFEQGWSFEDYMYKNYGFSYTRQQGDKELGNYISLLKLSK